MALNYADSFDYYLTADLLFKWTNQVSQAMGAGSQMQVSAGAVRNGIAGLRSHCTASGLATLEQSIRKTLAPGSATAIMGVAFRYSATPVVSSPGGVNYIGIASIMDTGTPQVQLVLYPDGTLGVVRGPNIGSSPAPVLGKTALALLAGNFYYVEWQVLISGSVGTVDLWVNGIHALALTSQNTQKTGNASWNQICLGLQQTLTLTSINAMDLDYDDLYVLDTAGAHNTARLGDVAVIYLHAVAGNGTHTDFTPSAGSDHGTLVADLYEDGDATYNAGSTVGNIDSYFMQHLTSSQAIAGVQSVSVCRKQLAGGANVVNLFRIASTDYASSLTLAPNQTYSQLLTPYDISPASGIAFTEAEINAMEGGLKVTA